MRIALVVCVLALVGCGGDHVAARSSCTLTLAEAPVPETGEHSLAVRSSCVVPSYPNVSLDRIPFTYVFEGGARNAHGVVFDKYRCDVQYRRIARDVRVGGAELRLQASLMDWCPAEAVSNVVHVYLGSLRRVRATRRDVFQDIYDGRLDRVWPCSALRDAIAHLPVDGPMYSDVGPKLEHAAAAACAAAVSGLARGAPRFAVEEALGTPSSAGPRCPVWRWNPESGSVDGARVCFARGRATTIQTAVHA